MWIIRLSVLFDFDFFLKPKTQKMDDAGVDNSKVGVSNDDEHSWFSSRWKSPADPASIPEDSLSAAEESAERVLNCIRPTLESEERRVDVIDHIQKLVKSRLHCEVVSYGSVPLKTYLPEGDIDLTVLKGPNAEENLAHDVLDVILDEEKNENADYEVRDVQFIDAEVKLVKCLVRNIVIDISCNQFGGISTLCFLEKVDRLVGRDHLFKRSIILVKTWCYYESRILGAHHGLISTYALEILVLYIFHFFHSSLSGPLSVLHRFLDYYSNFDWEKYCISLKGPLHRSSLPDIVVEMTNSGLNSPFLSEEFLDSCMEMFSFPCRGLEQDLKPFQIKHLNIMDPLKENNNLGRSVNRGNFFRIRSALKYGARELGQVLSRSREQIPDEIHKVFSNTLDRHEHQHRSNLQDLALDIGNEESLTASASSPLVLSSEDDGFLKSCGSDFDDDSVGLEYAPVSNLKNKPEGYRTREVSVEMTSESSSSEDGVSVSEQCMAGSGDFGLGTSNSSLWDGIPDNISGSIYSESLSENHYGTPRFSSQSSAENGSSESHQVYSACASQKIRFSSWLDSNYTCLEMNNSYRCCVDNSVAACITSSGFVTKPLDILDSRGLGSISTDEEPEAFYGLADLTGDYDSHIRSLLRGRLSHGFLSTHAVSNPPSSSPCRLKSKKPWDIVGQSMLLRPNNYSQMNSLPISMDHSADMKENTVYPKDHAVHTTDNAMFAADSAFLVTDFQYDWHQKARGTGTYFPKMNVVCTERSSHGRGKSKTLGNHSFLRRYSQHHGLHFTSAESNSFGNIKHKAHPAVTGPQGRRARSDVGYKSSCSVGSWNDTNRYFKRSCTIEFGSLGNLGEEVISGLTRSCSQKPQGTTPLLMEERVAGQSIYLNEDEFPPLCQ